MIVVMDLQSLRKRTAGREEVLQEYGYQCHLIRGENRIVVGAVGSGSGEIPPTW